MSKEIYNLYYYIKESARTYLSISIGIFLFILFFQPFLLESLDFNNKLIFIAGLGAIIYVIIIMVSALTYFFRDKIEISDFLNDFALLALGSVAFAFYLRYVGKEPITFYTMFKISLICISAPAILRIRDILKDLRIENESIIKEKKELQRQLDKYESENLHKLINFFSENASESLTVMVSEIVLIKSADNYVEIVYKEDDTFKKKLLRNTLKNIEILLKPYPTFARCHRICIVNTLYIEKIINHYGNHSLLLKGYDENIPVSRQYLLKLKEIA